MLEWERKLALVVCFELSLLSLTCSFSPNFHFQSSQRCSSFFVSKPAKFVSDLNVQHNSINLVKLASLRKRSSLVHFPLNAVLSLEKNLQVDDQDSRIEALEGELKSCVNEFILLISKFRADV